MEIVTPRLLLRDFRAGDLAAFAALFADPDFMEWSHRGLMTRPQVVQRLRQLADCYRANGFSKWAVIHRRDGVAIGYCGLEAQTIDGEEIMELGYRIAAPYRGRGLATEAARAAIADATERLRLPHVQAYVEPGNHGSIRILEKLGFAYQRNIRFHGTLFRLYRREAD